MRDLGPEHRRAMSNARNRKHYRAHVEKMREKSRRRRAEHPEASRENSRRHRFKTRYGITTAEYDLLLRFQENRCALCGEKLPEVRGFYHHVHLDHDHKTNTVRGILHRECNLMIGHARENPLRLIRGVRYLRRHGIPVKGVHA